MSCEKETYKDTQRSAENGNVLFLILIAVALFAALSYAVSTSSQVSPGGQGNEKGGIQAAQINIFPTVVRSQILRMVVKNIDVTELEFNPPSTFGTISDTDLAVFHPDAGTPYARTDPAVMANELQGDWYFNMNFEINNIGSSTPGSLSGNDIVAFLPGVKQNVCLRVNQENAVDLIPSVSSSSYLSDAMEMMDDSYTPPSTETDIGDGVLTELSGKSFGCFEEANSSTYIYYFALIEL